MKLKTLKDLRGHYKAGCIDWWELKENGEDVKFEDLKQEAIKRVKHLEEIKKNRKADDVYNEYSFGKLQGKIDVLIKFFNITEEDLKGGKKKHGTSN